MKRISWLFLLPALLGLFPGYQAQAQTLPQPRKGWSPETKDAAIGGAAGVLGGLLINGRNRKVGGLIGGLAGAGAGFALGKYTDNKRKAADAAAAQQAAAQEQAAADAQAAASQQAAAAEPTPVAQATAHAATERATAAHAKAAHAAAIRMAAERRLAAERRAEASQARGAAPAVADVAVAAGFFPNPGFDQAGTPYPDSAVLRKSW
ncbi:hypothetical protein [Hymenobacter baengnokdamensis]|uniref:hypothetical protein n=1 Tax=Hymenobacter baengnokdamensis TaxID=2615203 RepID=UPI001247AC22|nr:hypothetical protein [Hymenobacter baengnokdamensis]